MNNDQGREAPSFGDLFDDPDDFGQPADLVGNVLAPPTAAQFEPAESGPAPSRPAGPAEFEQIGADEAGSGDPDSYAPDRYAPDSYAPDSYAPESYAPEPDRRASDESALSAREPFDEDAAAIAAAQSAPGRLYRSTGATGPAALSAIPAIGPSYEPPFAEQESVAEEVGARSLQWRSLTNALPTGLTYAGVAVITFAATILVGFAEALLLHHLGALTGFALAVSSLYCAYAVRIEDRIAAVVLPPLAFLAATLTAGQLTLDSNGSLVIREGYLIFRSLAVNAPWILGSTLACLVIIIVRQRRAGSSS